MGPSLELEGSSGTEGAIPALPSLTVGPCISPGLGPGTQALCGPALPCPALRSCGPEPADSCWGSSEAPPGDQLGLTHLPEKPVGLRPAATARCHW